MESFTTSFLLPFSYVLLLVCVLAITYFLVRSIQTNYKKSKKTLWGIIGFLIVLAIGFFIAEPSNKYLELYQITGLEERWIDACLFATYVAGFVSILLILGVELKRAFNR